MNAWPKISVVMGVKNGAPFIERAIKSILEQNYPNLEFIILDAVSTDGTQAIVECYRPQLAIFESRPDNSPQDAFNEGALRSTGDWVIFFNADDVMAAGALRALAEEAQRHPQAKIISGGAETYDMETGRLLHRFNDPDKIAFTLENMLGGLTLFNSKLYARELFAKYTGLFAPFPGHRFFVANDRNFLIQMSLAKLPTAHVPDIVCQYYVHANSITFSGKNLLLTLEEHFWMADHWAAQTDSAHFRALLKAWKAQQYIVLAAYYFRQKEWAKLTATLKKGVSDVHVKLFTQFTKLLHRYISNRLEKLRYRIAS